jgi:hypothetical protein
LRPDLIYAEDLFADIDRIIHKLSVFEAVLIDGATIQKARTFSKTVKMGTEGVYSTYFVFAQVKNATLPIELDDRADDDDPKDLIDLFGSFFGDRRLRASNQVNLQKTHLKIAGTISYMNSYGYLNAEEYPMLRFYLMAFVFYLVASSLWIYQMRIKKEQVITIHYYFATLFLLTTVECTSAFIEYDLFNNSGKRSIGFSGFNVILKSARNTLSRLVALLIALGYGLVMNKIGSY